jgi:hypothetical protein
MPSFISDPKKPEANRLSANELELLVKWLRHEWAEPAARK